MIKYTVLFLTIFFFSASYAQSVVTFAGKPNDDISTKYESTSGVGLSNTYFTSPTGICFDTAGRMYISEMNKVRILTNNALYIRAGSLQSTSFSEGYKNATGTQATFRNPGGMEADANGNIYVADADNHCIRKIANYINLGNGQVVSTFAGTNPTAGLPGYGTSGSSDGTGSAASFNRPTDITKDASGNFYVTDQANYTIRKISPAGVVTTLAGTAGSNGYSDGTGAAAQFSQPWGIARYNSNTLVVTDPWNGNIRLINMFSGATTTLTGSTTGPNPQLLDGTLSEARFRSPKGVAVVDGIIYVNDYNVIRAINVSNNSVITFAGNPSAQGIVDGNGANAQFTELAGMETDGLGNLYVTEVSLSSESHVIRKVTINALAPSANFSTTKKNILTNEEVTLTDISSGQASTSRTWTITPSTFTIKTGDLSSEEMVLSFSVAGFYTVKLAIVNEFGIDTKTEENYYVVSTTGAISKYDVSNYITIYPNPATTYLNLEVQASLNTTQTSFDLYGMDGKWIQAIDPFLPTDISSLPNGTYFIAIKNKEISTAKKLIISHE
jgi:PKD repeat protein